MAAYIVLHNKKELVWHVGQKVSAIDINDIAEVQIDGDEMLEFTFPDRFATLTSIAAKLYVGLIRERYADAKEPIITEAGINNLMSGEKKSHLN